MTCPCDGLQLLLLTFVTITAYIQIQPIPPSLHCEVMAASSSSSAASSSNAAPPRPRVSPSYLVSPTPLLSPTSATLSSSISSASRSLSLASTHESSPHPRRYELAYPLYLRAARAFLWAVRNLSLEGEEEQERERRSRLKEKLKRQAGRALQRAERIREAKGAEWARRWGGMSPRGGGGGGGSKDVEEQGRRLGDSSRINGLLCDPWSLSSKIGAAGIEAFPLPLLSEKQTRTGAKLSSASRVFSEEGQGGCCLWDATRPLRGEDITQDAVSNCGLVAAMEVIAEHDFKWQTKVRQAQQAQSGDLGSGEGSSTIITALHLPFSS